MPKFILVVTIFFISLFPIYAIEVSNQVKDDIENLIHKAINSSGLKYYNKVGIIRSEIQENIHRLKFFDLVEESMESIFASRSSLVDRDRLKNIENDFKHINKKVKDVNEIFIWLDGTTNFEGIPLSMLEGIDYFAWSNIKQSSQDTIYIKISVLEIKSTIVKGEASGEIKIDDFLLSLSLIHI